MGNVRVVSRAALVGGAGALILIGALAGCSSGSEEPATPTTSTQTTSTQTSTTPSSTTPAAVAPTEKALTPGGDNSFTPSIDPTQPGGTCIRIVNGVCMR